MHAFLTLFSCFSYLRKKFFFFFLTSFCCLFIYEDLTSFCCFSVYENPTSFCCFFIYADFTSFHCCFLLIFSYNICEFHLGLLVCNTSFFKSIFGCFLISFHCELFQLCRLIMINKNVHFSLLENKFY